MTAYASHRIDMKPFRALPLRIVAVSALMALALVLAVPGKALADEPGASAQAPASGNPTGRSDTTYLDAKYVEEHKQPMQIVAPIARKVRLAVEQSRAQAAKEEAKRALQASIDAWYARFPAGDYSDVVLIGDSIMDEARSALAEAMPGVTVNADSGRSLEEGGAIRENHSPSLGVLDHIRSDSGTYARYVIGTGNNDVGGMPLSAAEEIANRLGPEKEIYFITEMVTGNLAGTNNTNATIEAMVAAHPNVHAIDWHAFVLGRESEMLRDVCHPRESAKPLYANLIKESLDAPQLH